MNITLLVSLDNRVLHYSQNKSHLCFVHSVTMATNLYSIDIDALPQSFDYYTCANYIYRAVGPTRLTLIEPADAATEALKELVQHKQRIYVDLYTKINFARAQYNSPVLFNQEISKMRYDQAWTVINVPAEFLSADPIGVSLVRDYADVTEVSLMEAAHDIRLKYDMMIDMLTITERMYQCFIHKISKATSTVELNSLTDEITQKMWTNILL